MKPLKDRHSPAYEAAKRFRRGVNLGDYLETPPGQSWISYSAADFASMHREGFDHIRVPVAWQYYTGAAPEFRLEPEIFAKADFVVTNALANQLAVIIDLHHFSAFVSDPAGQMDKLLAIWRQVGAHYAAFPDTVVFDLFNEPHDGLTTAMMNPIYARLIAEVRKSNPRRTLMVEPGDWNKVGELKNLVLPPDDNVMVSIHCYEPYYFTHQGASWGGPDVQVTGIRFPGPPAEPLTPKPALELNPWVRKWIHDYNTLPTAENPSSPAAFEDLLKLARSWSDYYGRPVHIGEFGCYTSADAESRARYHAALRRAAEAQHLGWAIWDWGAGFRYWDRRHNRPMPGLHEALFGTTR
jgi:endoglucanase